MEEEEVADEASIMAVLVQLMAILFMVCTIAHKSRTFLLDKRDNRQPYRRRPHKGDPHNRGLYNAILLHCCLWQPQSPFSQVPKELRIPNLSQPPDNQPRGNLLPDNNPLNHQPLNNQPVDK